MGVVVVVVVVILDGDEMNGGGGGEEEEEEEGEAREREREKKGWKGGGKVNLKTVSQRLVVACRLDEFRLRDSQEECERPHVEH
jgi:hypothetical protein